MSRTSPPQRWGFHDNGLKALSVAQLDASTRIRLAFHSEVRVLFMALLLDVLLDDFVRDVPRADAEVSARPHVPPPELLAQVRELVHQLVRGLPFQHLEQPADRHLRRDRDEQVHVILRDVPLVDGHLLVPADLADQFPEPGADLARHDRLAVLGNPVQMQVDLEGGVRAAPVVLHGGASYTTGAALHTR